MTRAFADLTKAGQTRRLRGLALEGLKQWPFRVKRLRLLLDGFNTIFRVDLASGERVVARVHRPGFREVAEIDAELAWVTSLAGQVDAGLPTPLFAADGAGVKVVAVDGVPEERAVSVLGWVAGDRLGKRRAFRDINAFGRAIAQLHVAGAAGRADGRFAALPLADSLYYLGNRVFDADHPLLGATPWSLFDRAETRCHATMARLRKAGVPTQPCHADLHSSNVHIDRGGRVGLLDFDDACRTWPAYDLGISYFYFTVTAPDEDTGRREWQALRAGYTAVAPWPVNERDLNTFRIARQLELVNSLIAFDDPHLLALASDYISRAGQRLDAWLSD